MTSDIETNDEHATREAVEGFGDWSDDDAFDASDVDEAPTRGGPSYRFLTDLADTLRGAGLAVNERDGWQTRQRNRAGYSSTPVGIVVHHTASPSSWDGKRDLDYLLSGAPAAPLANLYLDRSGTWWVLAAGATNTNGGGGPWGLIPDGGANTRVIGIEAANDGVGEPWPEVMQDSYVKGVAALADHYGIDINNVLSHYEWALPTGRGKIDPAGPSRFGSINQYATWDMQLFRAAVNEARTHRGSINVTAAPSAAAKAFGDDTYVVRDGDTWWGIAAKKLGSPGSTWTVLADANGGKDRVLCRGQVLKIPAVPGASHAAPPFPGEAKLGMKGPIVLAWQEALIAHRVIADSKDNRDSDYGPGMERKVLELQKSWKWPDANGIAGSATWQQLHS